MCAYHVWGSNIEAGLGSSYFEQLHKLGLVLECHTEKVEGVQINCSKNRVLGVVRAHRVFGARQVFETTFGHIENFWQKKIFENVPYLL